MTKISAGTKAGQQLTRALVALATQGRRPRCGDPSPHNYWLSEKAEERELAAIWCVGCPVLEQCGAAAEEAEERFGVWAGVDRTPSLSNRSGRGRRHEGGAAA